MSTIYYSIENALKSDYWPPLIQKRIKIKIVKNWKALIYKMPQYDLPVDKSVGYCLDYWLIWETQPTVWWGQPQTGGPECYEKAT